MTEKERILLSGALDLLDLTNKSKNDRFKFVFEGTRDQYGFFTSTLNKKVPLSGITLDNYDDDGFHCSIVNDAETAFKVGMVVAMCYTHIKNGYEI